MSERPKGGSTATEIQEKVTCGSNANQHESRVLQTNTSHVCFKRSQRYYVFGKASWNENEAAWEMRGGVHHLWREQRPTGCRKPKYSEPSTPARKRAIVKCKSRCQDPWVVPYKPHSSHGSQLQRNFVREVPHSPAYKLLTCSQKKANWKLKMEILYDFLIFKNTEYNSNMCTWVRPRPNGKSRERSWPRWPIKMNGPAPDRVQCQWRTK